MSMSLYSKYELDKLIASGETTTFRAHEIATRRIVYLHLIVGGKSDPLVEMVRRCPLGRILEVGELDDSPFVVTDAIVPFTSLRDWLQTAIQAVHGTLAPQPPAAEPPQPGVPANLAPGTPAPQAPGEFTRMLGQVAAQPPAPQAPPAGPGEFTRMFEAVPKAAPAVPSAPQPPQPGEFTRMFAPLADHNPAPASSGPPPPAPARGADQAPAGPAGEFTRMFGTPLKPPVPPAASAPGPTPQPFGSSADPGRPVGPLESPARRPSFGEPGDFGYLRAPEEPNPIDMDAIDRDQRPPVLEAPRSVPFQGAGEFTRMFGGPVIARPDSPAPAGPEALPQRPQLATSGGATGIFGREPGVPEPAADQPLGPSDYTLVVGGAPRNKDLPQPKPILGQPPVRAVQPIAPAPRRRILETVIGVGAGILLVLVVVSAVYFLAR